VCRDEDDYQYAGRQQTQQFLEILALRVYAVHTVTEGDKIEQVVRLTRPRCIRSEATPTDVDHVVETRQWQAWVRERLVHGCSEESVGLVCDVASDLSSLVLG
jgi:hypothetical protein